MKMNASMQLDGVEIMILMNDCILIVLLFYFFFPHFIKAIIVIVLVNWNGFPSIFQKVQYFHSRH